MLTFRRGKVNDAAPFKDQQLPDATYRRFLSCDSGFGWMALADRFARLSIRRCAVAESARAWQKQELRNR
jgi:hypothetical protein